jgi:predicted DCC family thiol-disulfide oxidoreductase YuxK
MKPLPDQPVLFFDGICDLCNAYVRFIIKYDREKKFLFSSLQSARGRETIDEAFKKTGKRPDSLILSYKGNYYFESEGAILSLSLLGGFWRLALGFRIVPVFFRDRLYRWVARNRYQWFGKKEECMIPTPELKARFLED